MGNEGDLGFGHRWEIWPGCCFDARQGNAKWAERWNREYTHALAADQEMAALLRKITESVQQAGLIS